MSLGVAPIMVGPMDIFRNMLASSSDEVIKIGSSSDGFMCVYRYILTSWL